LSGARVPTRHWARYSLYLTATTLTIEMEFREI
jgi:hypothetical protein